MDTQAIANPSEILEPDGFKERRRNPSGAPGRERRQFANSYTELSPEASELARAIDGYKLQNRRRFITYEEMLGVIRALGYHK